MDFRTHSATTYPSSVQPKICYLCMSVKSVDTWSSGHTSKLNVLFTGLKEFVSKNCIVGVSVKISGHTDFWTHNKTETPKDSQTGRLREQELYGHICFKPVDTWTFGHTAKNISLVYSERFFLKKHYWYVCLNQWTHGLLDTQQNNVYLL